MRFKSLFNLVTVLTLSSVISACGFHLRGEFSVPDELSTSL